MAYPGISDELLASVKEPNPLDVALLRQKVEPFATPPDGPLRLILDYGRLLLAANQRMSLTGAKDWDRLIPNHLVEFWDDRNFLFFFDFSSPHGSPPDDPKWSKMGPLLNHFLARFPTPAMFFS